MIYYGLVDSIPESVQSGIYSLENFDKYNLDDVFSDFELESLNFIMGGIPIVILPPKAYKLIFRQTFRMILKLLPSKEFIYQGNIVDKELNNDIGKKFIIIHPKGISKRFKIGKNEKLLFGLFDNFPNRNLAFRKILGSKGFSQLVILEKDNIPNGWHYGSKEGKFSFGLYGTHPKNNRILIPLENYNEIVKNLIIEEILRAYAALGAKKIEIEDLTEFQTEVYIKDSQAIGVKGDLQANYKRNIIRNKEFGKSPFNASRLKDSLFIHDFPAIQTTIDDRIKGNQILEELEETINIGVNADIGVLNLFTSQANFNFTRKWHIRVEFYDKNQL